MANAYAHAFRANMQGRDAENAFAKALMGKVSGGVGDGGKDVKFIDEGRTQHVQVKSSPKGALSFLAESLRRRQYIPICLGEPGTQEEITRSLREHGAYVGPEIPARAQILQAAAFVRSQCRAA